MAYRVSRNLEASIIDFLQDNFDDDWTGINVEKTYSKIYDLSLPSICIRCGVTDHEKIELGDNNTVRTPQILIDIFAENDGQRLDLKDYIVEKIKNGCPYYEYTIANGQVQSKIENGRIRVMTIDDSPINFDGDRNALDPHDRYRHLLTFTVSTGKVEA